MALTILVAPTTVSRHSNREKSQHHLDELCPYL